MTRPSMPPSDHVKTHRQCSTAPAKIVVPAPAAPRHYDIARQANLRPHPAGPILLLADIHEPGPPRRRATSFQPPPTSHANSIPSRAYAQRATSTAPPITERNGSTRPHTPDYTPRSMPCYASIPHLALASPTTYAESWQHPPRLYSTTRLASAGHHSSPPVDIPTRSPSQRHSPVQVRPTIPDYSPLSEPGLAEPMRTAPTSQYPAPCTRRSDPRRTRPARPHHA